MYRSGGDVDREGGEHAQGKEGIYMGGKGGYIHGGKEGIYTWRKESIWELCTWCSIFL